MLAVFVQLPFDIAYPVVIKGEWAGDISSLTRISLHKFPPVDSLSRSRDQKRGLKKANL